MKAQTTTEKKAIETFLPIFSGYYSNSYWDTSQQEEDELNEVNQQREAKGWKEVTWNELKFNYQEHQEELSKAITDAVEELMEEYVESITFQKLVSPKFYNFTNDSINVEIVPKVEAIENYLKDNAENFEKYLKEKYTSRDGFSSSYPNNNKEYMQGNPLEDKHKLGSILDFIAQNDEITEYEVNCKVSDNGEGYIYCENMEFLTENEEIED